MIRYEKGSPSLKAVKDGETDGTSSAVSAGQKEHWAAKGVIRQEGLISIASSRLINSFSVALSFSDISRNSIPMS